jgi:hypothetical protein
LFVPAKQERVKQVNSSTFSMRTLAGSLGTNSLLAEGLLRTSASTAPQLSSSTPEKKNASKKKMQVVCVRQHLLHPGCRAARLKKKKYK